MEYNWNVKPTVWAEKPGLSVFCFCFQKRFLLSATGAVIGSRAESKNLLKRAERQVRAFFLW